jgi:hypothetical protein
MPGKYCLQDRQGLLSLSQVLSPEFHENIPPLPAKSLSRLTCPATAWPKYRTRRVDLQTEERIINLRRQGNSRCEIRDILRENAASVPSATSAGGMAEQITPGSETGTEEKYHEQNRGISAY